MVPLRSGSFPIPTPSRIHMKASLKLACSIALSATALADNITLTPTQDNTIYLFGAGNRSNGAGGTMFVGVTGNGGSTRALVKFDVSGAVPAGSTINSASLQLRMVNVANTAAPTETQTVHRLTADWGEGTSTPLMGGGSGGIATTGDATWLNTFYPSMVWGTAGGDFVAAPSVTQTVGVSGSPTFSSAALAADVQSWLDGTAGQFGWLIKDDESGVSARVYSTREGATAPALTIDFTPPSSGIGFIYCSTSPNSSGLPATLTGSGSATAADNNFTVTATDLPPNQFGIFVTSQTQALPGAINLCLGGSIGRFTAPSQILSSGAGGTFFLSPDLTAFPQGNGSVPVMAGQTWNFQAWFRDSIGIGSNFTDGLEIQFN